MPRDLLAEAGIKVDQPQVAPRDLLAEAGISPNQLPNNGSSTLSNIASYPSSLVGGVGRSLVNQTGAIDKNLTSALNYASPAIEQKLTDYTNQLQAQAGPSSLLANIFGSTPGLPQTKPVQDYLSASEAKNPVTSKVGEMVGNAIPFMLAPELTGLTKAGFLPRIALQSGVGAATNDNPALGGVLGGVAEAVNPLISGLASKIGSKLWSPNLTQKANELWQTVRGKFGDINDPETISKIEGSLHDKAMDQAGYYDSMYSHNVSDQSYQDALDSMADKIQLRLKHNPNSPELNGAYQQLIDWADAPHSTLQEMIQHNKQLNSVYGGEIKPGVPMPDWLPSYAIKSIKNTINENLENNGLKDSLGQAIQDANQATKERVKFNMFKDASNENDILNRFNKMDPDTQANLFSDSDITKIKDFEKAYKGNKMISTPPHLMGSKDYLQKILRRFPGGAISAGINQPLYLNNAQQTQTSQ